MNPPAALQNAMGRERKPFTYTPGGLDLSEIKSERMAARLMRNAMNEGVPVKPISAVQTPTTPTTHIAVPNYNCLPVQVFPAFSLPANPKSLLRTRSTPGQSREPPPNFEKPFVPKVNNYYETIRPTSMYSNMPAQNNVFDKSYDDYRNSAILTPSYDVNYYQTAPTFDVGSSDKQNIDVPQYSSLGPELSIVNNKPFVDLQTTNYGQNVDKNSNQQFSSYNPSTPQALNEENKMNIGYPYGITNYGFEDGSSKFYESEPNIPQVKYGTLAYAVKQEDSPKTDESNFRYQPEKCEITENEDPNHDFNEPSTITMNDININNETIEINNKNIQSEDIKENITDIEIKPLVSSFHIQESSHDIKENLDEQSEVKVVKKVKKEKKSEEISNQTENEDDGAKAELTVKLPSKKSAAKTETKVEVLTKTLPDGSIEETKKTITKTTIDGRTEIKTKVETKTIPKESAIEVEEEEEEEEEEEIVVENGAGVQENGDVVEEPETTVVIKQAPKTVENGSTVVKEEKSETTTTRKLTVVQSGPNVETEEEEEEEYEEEVEEIEEPKKEIKQELPVEKKSEPEVTQEVEQDDEEEEVEEKEEDNKAEEQQETVVESKQVVEEKVIENDEEEAEEEKEEKMEKTETKIENPVESAKVQQDEESEYTEEEYESEVEETPKTETKPETKEEVKEKPSQDELQKEEEPKETPKEEEKPKEEKKPEPTPKPETVAEPPKPAPREIPIHLDVVEDIEIKPIGPASETISKSHTESTEIIRNKDSLGGPISTQTELHRVENIVVSNRITKSLDHSYEQMTQGLPTVKTYFPPSRERVETSPQPAKPYQPTFSTEPTTERRHSLLLERLSMERQIPPPLQQYQNTYQTYNNQSYESQREISQEPRVEVVNLPNVKPSAITNQQWYQQSNKDNVIYNNTASQSWSQPQAAAQPQYQQQYQPSPKPQYQAQPQYQAPAQPQYQAPPQPQYQAPAQPQYKAPTQSQSTYTDNYTQNYSKNVTSSQENSYQSYTPKPSTWGSSTLDSLPTINAPTNQYPYQNTDSSQSYQNTQNLTSSYVPPPWEQDSTYVAPQNTSTIYYKPADLPTNTDYQPSSTPAWKPTPPTSKFTKPTSTAYVPPAPNQSFVKPVIAEPPKVAGRKTYYSEYERRYISVPESTYVPAETKYQPPSDPSPQYYYDNGEQAEKSEHTWRKELREFTEKTTQNEYQTQQASVNPPWEETTYAKNPSVAYTPTPTWSQTLRPGSGRERSFESEFVSQERSKTNTLGRNRPVSYIHSSVESPLPDRARGVSVDRYNPNAYHSPIPSEHSPVQVKTLTPETAPAKNYHNPHVPAYHNRASAEPREQSAGQYHQPRGYNDRSISPIQSRSFKYLQWITGTEH